MSLNKSFNYNKNLNRNNMVIPLEGYIDSVNVYTGPIRKVETTFFKGRKYNVL